MSAPRKCTHCGEVIRDRSAQYCPTCLAPVGVLADLIRVTRESNARIREGGPVGILGIFGVRTRTG